MSLNQPTFLCHRSRGLADRPESVRLRLHYHRAHRAHRAPRDLAATVSLQWLLPTAFADINQLLYVATGAGPATRVIERLHPTHARPVMLVPDHHEET